ncbi:EamA family transporter [Chelatococcus reniformis]|uniref:Membrane protein n=1 Tax=Chelatococcus reniformis TaxID=1494448 RepID=A0A916X836_9HYPH|nr:EamA family transporter [Chelatococcus reniformis]GGC49181.1 membrane protein [Chelatococcus reniformis]
MSGSVFAIILFAAALHATWNAIVKGAGDKLMMTVLVAGAAALMAAAGLPLLPAPAVASWPFMAASAVVQVGYYLLVARAYHVADMSQTYPLMRGAAPLLVALVGVLWIGEALSPRAWLGIAVTCLGVLAMAAGGGGGSRQGVAVALANAVVIAAYTLIDGAGVRASGAPAAYTLWVFLLTGLPLVAWALLHRRPALGAAIARRWRLGLLGGACTLVSYGLALWAMTAAPVAVIAALRETSILFGTAISALVLGERVGAARLAAVMVIAAGAAVLRLA